MKSNFVFISHASADDGFVKELRQTLEGQELTVWADSRELSGGDKLTPTIELAIEQARQVLVVLSPQTVNSPWVRREVRKALDVEKQRADDGYRVIPVLLPGITAGALGNWFDEEPVAVSIQLTPGGLSEALPHLLAALGERLPNEVQSQKKVEVKPVEELLLKLSDPVITTEDNKRRVTATATLGYEPATPGVRGVESKRFSLTAPFGPIEADNLRWYLESYYQWPIGVFKQRAERIEKQLPQWGQELYRAAVSTATAQEALNAWQHAATGAERRFSVLVDSDLPEGTDENTQQAAREAASALLRLPWELLHDSHGYLFQGKHAARVRRRLPNRRTQEAVVTALPIRILLVSPRPEDERASYIDHRISALPLVEAVEQLGELATLTVLTPPTLPALEAVLQKAADAGQPFHVVHFDGHGIYDREHGLGGLCFEDPKDLHKLQKRTSQLLYADALAAVIRDHRIPLVFLEACQSAQVENDPTASVAAKLLAEGVTSVVAMSHSVLVETARRFVKAFYEALAQGARVGQAMLAGQQALYGDTYRGRIMGAGELRLQDWFVPVLYQEEYDPQLFTALPSAEARRLQERQDQLSLGDLPAPPSHTFRGRSRALLALERLLHTQSYAVVSGPGGNGKTALVVELARWLVRTDRFRRAAFVSLETYTDARGVLDSLGRQVLPEGDKYSVAQYPDLKKALQPVQRALADQPTLIVLDNMESVLPDASEQIPVGATPIDELLQLCENLRDAHPATRLVFTSREALPAPFNQAQWGLRLGTLDRNDAIDLVSQVLAQEGRNPPTNDAGQTSQEIIDLVEAVNCHPRALVLMAPEVSRRGVRATTENLQHLMAELDRQHPGDPENSLYASAELSLRRLPPEMRQQAQALAVFHGGAHLNVLAYVLEVDVDIARTLAIALIDVGLAEDAGYGHLRLDPALPSYLLGQIAIVEQNRLRTRWAEGLRQLLDFLYEQRSRDAEFALQLAIRELPNLLTFLQQLEKTAVSEEVADIAGRMEDIVASLGRPRVLAQVSKVRGRVIQMLEEWGHVRFEADRRSIERLLDENQYAAQTAASHLLECSLRAGEKAYPQAAYDIALAHLLFGQVLRVNGAVEAALPPLAEAQRRFEILATAGSNNAAIMVSTTLTERGNCLAGLGQLDEAAAMYEKSIARDEQRNDKRGVAVNKIQLGTVRRLQKRYPEALAIFIQTRALFESLGEPVSVAILWHRIGMVHREMDQFESAERAYRQSLVIMVQQQDYAGQAMNFGELGNLYYDVGRWEEAGTFFQQAIDLYVILQDFLNEGLTRSNLAATLIKLQRYDDARIELQQAQARKDPYGHAGIPWMTWDHLHGLEQAVCNPQAAAQARQNALQSYLAYRREGGAFQTLGCYLCDLVGGAIQKKEMTIAKQAIAQSVEADPKPWTLIPKLQAILNGNCDPALASDPELYYQDAAELQLLLERLKTK